LIKTVAVLCAVLLVAVQLVAQPTWGGETQAPSPLSSEPTLGDKPPSEKQQADLPLKRRSGGLHFRRAQSIVQSLMSKDSPSDPNSLTSFTLFGSDLIDRLEGALGLVRDGRGRIGPRVLISVLISWVPLLLLAAAQGLAIGPTRLESFLMDFAVNVRLLVVVPVFLLGEAIGGAQLSTVVQQFLDAGLVKEESRAKFDATVKTTVCLSRSRWTDVLLLSLAYLHSAAVLFALLFELQTSTWRVSMTEGHDYGGGCCGRSPGSTCDSTHLIWTEPAGWHS